jgi:hypothetical protein
MRITTTMANGLYKCIRNGLESERFTREVVDGLGDIGMGMKADAAGVVSVSATTFRDKSRPSEKKRDKTGYEAAA